MPRAFSDQERHLVQQRLRQAGREAFAAYGLRASVDDLVRAAGISKGAFYLFHESKEALLLDILTEVEADLQARLLDRVLAPGVAPRESLRELLRQTISARQADPLLRRLGPGELAYLARRVPPERAEALRLTDVAAVTRFLDHWRARGVTFALDADVLTGLLRALFFAGLHAPEIGAEAYPRVLDLLVEGVAAAVIPAEPTVSSISVDPASAEEASHG